MPDKRIVFLHYRLDRTGVDRVACYLADGFARAGYQVDLIVFSDGGSGETALLPLLSDSVNLVYLGSSHGNRTKHLVRFLPACVAWINQNNPDMLLATCNHMNWITVVAKKLSRIRLKVVLKTSNPILRSQDRGLYGAIRKLGFQISFQNSEKILALSDAETELLSFQFPNISNKFTMVHNPYVTSALLAKPKSHDPLVSRKPIIAVGQFETRKRFDLLIKAFALIDQQDVNLILLGDGSQRPSYEKLVSRLNLSDRISMPGFVSDVTDWLQKSDLLVMTSLSEGLPAVVLEALAADCRVLTTDCFLAARSILEPLSGCSIIESDDPAAIARSIENVLGQPKDVNLHSVVKSYSIENGIHDHIAQIEAVFRQHSMRHEKQNHT